MPSIVQPTEDEIELIQELYIQHPDPVWIRAFRKHNEFWFCLKLQDGNGWYGWSNNIRRHENARVSDADELLEAELKWVREWPELDLSSLGYGVSEVNGKKNFRRYICTEDGHNKYWEIWMPNSTAITTHWGAIGTDGSQNNNNYSDDYSAQNKYNSLCTSKLAKGYKLDTVTAKIEMPKVPAKPKEPTASDEGLCEALDILDLD